MRRAECVVSEEDATCQEFSSGKRRCEEHALCSRSCARDNVKALFEKFKWQRCEEARSSNGTVRACHHKCESAEFIDISADARVRSAAPTQPCALQGRPHSRTNAVRRPPSPFTPRRNARTAPPSRRRRRSTAFAWLTGALVLNKHGRSARARRVLVEQVMAAVSVLEACATQNKAYARAGGSDASSCCSYAMASSGRRGQMRREGD
eukprot:4927298-Pleurochrysis_carterae.AAC.1